MNEAIVFILGVVVGAVLFLVVHLLKRREAREIARELVSETEAEKSRDLELLVGKIREIFGSLSHEALRSNTEQFLSLAQSVLSKQTVGGEKDLEAKKKLIDQTLESMRGDLKKVEELMATLEKDRAQKFGELASGIRMTAEQTARLQETTEKLRQALASTKARGQWGERMAEDVLRLSGFIEGVNYLKQKALDAAASRPDYTFPLPKGQKINMDVKFPLSNFLRYLEAESEAEREACKAQFLRDVRARIKEVTGRDYINPEDQTLDYVLVFIPNEQVYAFINQNDPSLIDDALKSKVILCSPFTLYAILAIIRQAMDNFNLERAADDMLKLMGSFFKEWGKYRESMDRMGKKLGEAREEFDRLVSTRSNKLEKPLRAIEEIRRQKGIEAVIDLGEFEAGEPEAETEVKALGDGSEEEPGT